MSIARLCLILALAACGASQNDAEPADPAPVPTEPGPTEPGPTEPVPPEPSPEGPATAAGRSCGSRGMQPCADTEYCDFEDGTQCGAADQGGVCRARPGVCTRELNPVCGCDGRTYPTRCVAASQGVDTATMGECPAP